MTLNLESAENLESAGTSHAQTGLTHQTEHSTL
jgi:hypothetical protein